MSALMTELSKTTNTAGIGRVRNGNLPNGRRINVVPDR